MTKLVNLTPHPVVLMTSAKEIIATIPPQGDLARCSMERSSDESIQVNGHNVPVTSVTLGPLEGLPAPAEGTLFIVSRVAAEAAKRDSRTDVVCPDDALRDEAGRIIGCKALARV